MKSIPAAIRILSLKLKIHWKRQDLRIFVDFTLSVTAAR